MNMTSYDEGYFDEPSTNYFDFTSPDSPISREQSFALPTFYEDNCCTEDNSSLADSYIDFPQMIPEIAKVCTSSQLESEEQESSAQLSPELKSEDVEIKKALVFYKQKGDKKEILKFEEIPSIITYPRIEKRTRFTKEQKNVLNKWFYDHVNHPYPTPNEIQKLAERTHLTVKQIRTYFVNNRIRNDCNSHKH